MTRACVAHNFEPIAEHLMQCTGCGEVRSLGESETRRRKPRQIESKTVQQPLVRWANMQQFVYPQLQLLYSIPNGGKRSAVTASRMKAEGARKSMPDLCLPVATPRGNALYIECKAAGRRDTRGQREMHALLRHHGNAVEVVDSLEGGIEVLKRWCEEAKAV